MGARCCCSYEGNSAEVVHSVPVAEAEALEEDLAEGADALPPDSVLRVTISGAQGLASSSWKEGEGPKAPYCVCEVSGDDTSRVSTPPSSAGTRDPAWNFRAVLPSCEARDTVLFTVFDKDSSSDEEHLGRAEFTISMLEEGKGTFEGPLPLVGVKGVTAFPLLNVKIEVVPAEHQRRRLLQLRLQRKQGQTLGLGLCSEHDALLVAKIFVEGVAADYNKGVRVQDQLQVGDLVLQANGSTTEEAIIKELTSSADVDLLVECRACIFRLCLSKPFGEKLGLRIEVVDSLLVIERITEGPVQDYNRTAPEGRRVMSGDHIISANGVQGREELAAELQKPSGPIELLIRHAFDMPGTAKESLLVT